MKLTSRTQLANAYARVRKMLALCGKYADPRSAIFDYQDESNEAWYIDYIKDCARLTLKQFINEGTEFKLDLRRTYSGEDVIKVELDGINVSIIVSALLDNHTTYLQIEKAFIFHYPAWVQWNSTASVEAIILEDLNRGLYGANPKNWLIG